MTAQEERRARRKVNDRLYDIGLTYWESIPLSLIDMALVDNGFTELEGAIYCGRDGQTSEQIGERTWLALSWHKMESGKYEVVAYVN